MNSHFHCAVRGSVQTTEPNHLFVKICLITRSKKKKKKKPKELNTVQIKGQSSEFHARYNLHKTDHF